MATYNPNTNYYGTSVNPVTGQNTPGGTYNAPTAQNPYGSFSPTPGPLIPQGQPLDSGVLNGNAAQLQVPPAPITMNPQQFVQGITAAPLQMAASGAGTGAQEKSLTAAQKRLMEVQKQLTGQGAEQQRLEQQAGIPQLNKQVQDLTNELTTKKAAFDQEALRISGNAMTQEGLIGRTSRLRREEAIELGGKSAALMALQGNLQGAKEEVDRTLKFEFDPIRQELENTKTFIEMNYQNLTRAEKREADALKIQVDRENKRIDFMYYMKKAAYDQALKYGATAAQQKLLSNPNATPNEILKSFGSQAIVQTLEPKVLSTPQFKTIDALGPAIRAIDDYKKMVELTGSNEKLNGKNAGLLKSAYGDAISAWKTLAGLGALSGADFGLAENVIPEPTFFTRNKKVKAQLDGAISRAKKSTSQAAQTLKMTYPGSSMGIDAMLQSVNNPQDIGDMSSGQFLEQVPGESMNDLDNASFYGSIQ